MTVFFRIKRHLKTYEIVKTFQYRSLQKKIKSNKNLFCHSVTNNIGDLVCSPYDYFPDLAEDGVKINNHELVNLIRDLGVDYFLKLLKGKRIIFGGGGLIAMERHEKHLDVLKALASYADLGGQVIIWGAGHNRIDNFYNWFFRNRPHFYPEFFEAFTVGVRDFGTKYDWVPCVSCMHSAFDDVPSPSDEVVAFLHGKESKGFDVAFENIPTKYNIDLSYSSDPMHEFKEVVEFLARGKVVVTNSYHGMYWATLLGRRVIALPNASKFLSFKYESSFCYDVADWRSKVACSQQYPQALEECREATMRFYKERVENSV
jgi:hypothetical protein